MSIRTASARFNIQANFAMDAISFEWPEYSEFLISLKGLQQATSYSRPSETVQRVLSSARLLRKILTTSPVTPAAAIKVLKFPSLKDEAIEASTSSYVENLYLKINQLIPSVNPFSNFAEEVISADLGKPDGNPDISLFVHKSAVEITKEWLSDNELVAEVMSVSATKHSESFYSTGLLFGLPEQHIYTHIQMNDIKSQAAWILTAPIVEKYLICIGPGSDSFNSKDYEPWPGCWENAIKAAKPPAKELLHVDVEPTWTPSRPIFEDYDRDVSIETACTVLTIDNKWIVFDSIGKYKPIPLVLDADSEFVEKKFKDLSPGDVLAIHYGKSSQEFLKLTAATFLSSKGKDIDSILQVVNEFKSKFKILASTVDAQERLLKAGLERDFVNYWLRYINIDSSICPESEENYLTIAQICGISKSLINHKHMRDYRNAIQHAGNIARIERLNELKLNKEWKALIQNGSYLMNLTNAGSMLIAPIKEVHNDTFAHPATKLGLVYSSLGEMLEE
jgi:hypothetical protein